MSSDVDDLYALPAGDFVAARDALVKRLRADGDKAQAAEVKKLPRPSAAAAVVNALVRTEPDVLDALWAAADALRGREGASLRAATAAQREALAAAVDAARGLDPAPSATTLDRVLDVLRAAAGDPAVREEVVSGRLAREPSAEDADPLAAWSASVGGGGGAATKPARTAAKKKPKAPAEEDDAAARKAAERRKALEARLAEAEAVLAETAKASKAAEKISKDRQAAATKARDAAEAARAKAADAQKASRDAQAQAEEAAEALTRAERAVKRLQGELD